METYRVRIYLLREESHNSDIIIDSAYTSEAAAALALIARCRDELQNKYSDKRFFLTNLFCNLDGESLCHCIIDGAEHPDIERCDRQVYAYEKHQAALFTACIEETFLIK